MAKDVKNAAMADANNLNASNAALQQQMTQTGSGLQTDYSQMLKTGFASPQAQVAQTNATMGPLGATYDALRQNATNTAARTNNSAALPALLTKLAQSKGSQGAQINSENVAKGQSQGLEGLAQMYGVDANMLAKTLGLPADYLNTAQKASEDSIGNAFASTFGAGLGKAVAGFV